MQNLQIKSVAFLANTQNEKKNAIKWKFVFVSRQTIKPAQILLIAFMIITFTYNAFIAQFKTALLCKERNQNGAIYITKLIFCWSPELLQILEQQFLRPNHSLQAYWKHVYVTLLNSSFIFLKCLCNEFYTIIPYNSFSMENVFKIFPLPSRSSCLVHSNKNCLPGIQTLGRFGIKVLAATQYDLKSFDTQFN